METTIPKIKSKSDEMSLRKVVAEIMTNEHAYCVDGEPQYDVWQTAMVLTQDSILEYVQTHWLLDKDEINDLSFRCKEVSKYLDLISEASVQNRYAKPLDFGEEPIKL